MQVTFLATILVGVPVVALASLFVTLPGWGERAEFAIRAGAFVWFLTGLIVFLYARTYRDHEADAETTTEANSE
jgi:hypothetical protein